MVVFTMRSENMEEITPGSKGTGVKILTKELAVFEEIQRPVWLELNGQEHLEWKVSWRGGQGTVLKGVEQS